MRRTELTLAIFQTIYDAHAMDGHAGLGAEEIAERAIKVAEIIQPKRKRPAFASKTAEDAARSERDYVLASFPSGDTSYV